MTGSTTQHQRAWEDAKAAVRAYARDPSDDNAQQVTTLLAKARAVAAAARTRRDCEPPPAARKQLVSGT